MSEDSVMGMPVPGVVADPLTELLRVGARKLLAQAVEAELAQFLDQVAAVRDGRGRQAVGRNGYPPERRVVTGIGPLPVRVPKVRDRRAERVVFRSAGVAALRAPGQAHRRRIALAVLERGRKW